MATTIELEKGQKTVHITRTFDLPSKKVWQALTEPESFKKWWGPEGFTCPYCSIDLKVGGKYLACMRSSDGTDFWSTGHYEEIIPFKKLVCTDSFSNEKGNIVSAASLGMPGNWPTELLVTYILEEVNGKTKLTMDQVGIPDEMYDDCIQGWNQSLDKLEKNLK